MDLNKADIALALLDALDVAIDHPDRKMIPDNVCLLLNHLSHIVRGMDDELSKVKRQLTTVNTQ